MNEILKVIGEQLREPIGHINDCFSPWGEQTRIFNNHNDLNLWTPFKDLSCCIAIDSLIHWSLGIQKSSRIDEFPKGSRYICAWLISVSNLRKAPFTSIDNFIFCSIFSVLYLSSIQVADQWTFPTACDSQNKNIFSFLISCNTFDLLVDYRNGLHHLFKAVFFHVHFLKDYQ